MAVGPGAWLRDFEIVSCLGEGGMGQVFLAHDHKLNRDVALKLLPDAFGHDPARRARLEREAKALAALGHRGIASIHEVFEVDGRLVLVMQLVEGRTLAQILQRGPLPLRDALSIARDIADALAYAHEHGILHRDLKPANIKIKPDGTAMLLDFGLAKGVDVEGSGASAPTAADLTGIGMVLGTAPYMSPEQARGEDVDRRTDVFAFGSVLYELLTGCQAFPARTSIDALAAVLAREPDLQALPLSTPVRVRELIQHCLRKDRHNRLHDLADARIELDEALKDPTAGHQGAGPPAQTWRTGAAAAALVLLGALVAFFGSRTFNQSGGLPPPTARVSVTLPPAVSVATPGDLAISPDGQTLVFVGQDADTVRLYTRRLNESEPHPLAGTERAAAPFFSPDGQWIAFFSVDDSALKKVPLGGGPEQVICKGCTARAIGGCWPRNDRIFFAAWPGLGLWRVSADGGTPEIVLKPNDNAWFMWPTIVGDRGVLYTVWRDGRAEIDAAFIDTDERHALIDSASRPRVLPSGHLAYFSDGRLLVAPFDPEHLALTGSPVVAVDGVVNDVVAASYDISSTGTLAYVSGSASLEQIVWRDRHGETTRVTTRGARYSFPMLSPRDDRLVTTINEGFRRNLWIGNVGQEPLTRLTSGNDDVFSLWMPDGKRIAFTSGRGGQYNLFVIAADGGGQPARLTVSANSQKPTSVSPAGDVVLFNENAPSTGLDIWRLRLVERDAPEPYLQTRFNELEGMLSPDGRWLAYMSDETGRFEIYVQAYPAPAGKRQVSLDGGLAPAWNSNGKEIFYLSSDAVFAVSVSTDGGMLRTGNPVQLFGHHRSRLMPGTDYSVARGGERFLMVESPQPGSGTSHLNVVLNWAEELKRNRTIGTRINPETRSR